MNRPKSSHNKSAVKPRIEREAVTGCRRSQQKVLVFVERYVNKTSDESRENVHYHE